MVNKLWHLGFERDGVWYPRDISWARKYIQEIIDLYCLKLFKVPEDINPDNFQHFLEAILVQFQNYNIDICDLWDLGEIMEDYFYDSFKEYRNYSKDDRRALTFKIFDYSGSSLMPEDVPFIMECFNAPDDQVIHMYDKLKQYFDQFDRTKQANEERLHRWLTVKKQRLEALEKGDPLPIRPMGIKLDSCYKDGSKNNKE